MFLTANTEASNLVGEIHPLSFQKLLKDLPALAEMALHRLRLVRTARRVTQNFQDSQDERDVEAKSQALRKHVEQFLEVEKASSTSASANATHFDPTEESYSDALRFTAQLVVPQTVDVDQPVIDYDADEPADKEEVWKAVH